MKRVMITFAIWWAVFSLGACALAQPVEISLRIIGINDFHGALVETSSYAGAAKIASAVESLKAEAGGDALVLSAGDMMQGSIESNMERGRTVVTVMNHIGVDAMTLGNHEFDWGLSVLEERMSEMRFPCLAANVRERDSEKVPQHLKPYTIIEENGLRIGVVGLITTDTAVSVNPKHIRTLMIADPMMTAAEAVRAVREQDADIVILLVHMDCWQDEVTGALSGEAAELAKIDDVDIIISGHSHTLVNGAVNGVPVVQAASKGQYLDVIDIVYSREKNDIVSYQAQLYQADSSRLLPCREMESVVKKAIERTEKIRAQEAARIPYDLEHDRSCVSSLGCVVSDGIRAAVDADIAFQNGGGIRIDKLEAGVVTQGELYEMLPFDNTICTAYLTGAQIIDILEQGLFDEQHSILQYSGMDVVCDVTRPQGERIISVHLADGRELLAETKYFVAYNDFMAEGGDGYPHLSKAEELTDTNIDLREAIGEYLRAQEGNVLIKECFYSVKTANEQCAA